MAYIIEDDLLADIPSEFLAQALADGTPVAFSVIADRASDKVDAVLIQRMEVPLPPGHVGLPIAKEAARVFALESLYKRRGYSKENNPWTDDADTQMRKLNSIIKKNEPFALPTTAKKSSTSVVTEKARTHSNSLSL